MTSSTFSIYFLLKIKTGLANLWKLIKIKREKKNFWIGSSSKFKCYYFSRKLILLKQISLKIIIYGQVFL